jgi:cytochrome c oxidase cbb3-type subunit 2
VAHLIDPRALVPESVMPGYPFMARRRLDTADLAGHLEANRAVGVPYSETMIENALADLRAQADPEADDAGLRGRYGDRVGVADFDGNPAMLSELDALIAYLQMLGTTVDFSAVTPEDLRQ